MNLALLQAGYPITCVPLVLPGDYLDALQASDRGDEGPFIHLVSNLVVESQRDYLRLLKNLGEE